MKKSLMLMLIVLFGLFTALSATTLLSPTGDGGFETGTDFAANNWTTANGALTVWTCGTDQYTAGSRGAYITESGVYTYSATSQFVHLYHNITVPSGESNLSFSFKWKALGEGSSSDWDNIKVFLAPSTYTPTAGTAVTASYQVGATWYNNQTSWQTASFMATGVAAGDYKVIFTWKTDSSGSYPPPAALDEISITSEAPPPPLTGTKTINPVGGDYTSFTAAINALNLAGVGTGGVTFNVAAGTTYTENCPPITATGTSSNPIVFQRSGTGANPIIYAGVGTGSADAIVKLESVDWLTWNGIDLYENSANTSALTQAEYGLWVTNTSASNGSQYNLFTNFKIMLNNTNTSTRGINHYYGLTPNSADGANSYNDYYNITIENVYYGFYLYSYNSTTNHDKGNTIRFCTIGGGSAGDIKGPYGIYAYYQENVTIRNNEIRNIGYTSTVYGIYTYYMFGIDNLVYNNKVHDIAYTGTSTSSNYGIYLYLYTSGTSTVKAYNNMVWGQTSGYTGTGSSSYAIYGIYVYSGGTSTVYNVDFNTVRVDGPAGMSSAAIYNYAVTGVRTFRNNVLANVSPNATYSSAYHVCLYTSSATSVGATGSASDNNVMYVANSTGGYAVRGSTTNYPTLAAWQNDTVYDDNSRDTNPLFVSASDVHIQTGVPTPVESKGSYFSDAITWVTTDIDGNPRYNKPGYSGLGTAPDIGADEGDFTLEAFCQTPTAQPTVIVFNPPASTVLSGSFTAASPAADDYLVVRHATTTLGAIPTDTKTYAAGDTLGANGTVVSKPSLTTFSATGLQPDSLYYFTIFSYNTQGIGGPKYLTTSPLTGSQSTLPTAPANPSAFTAEAYSYQQVNLAATATDSIMVIYNYSSTFGTPVSTPAYAVSDTIVGGGEVVYIGPAAGLGSHAGLSSGTTYYYKAFCYVTSGGIYKVYSTGLASTPASVTTDIYPPYTQDFQGTFPPGGWARYSGLLSTPTTLTSGTRWTSDDWCNISSNPDDAAKVNIYSNNQDWFITPRIYLPGDGYVLKFKMCLTDFAYNAPPDLNGTDDRFIVLIGDGTSWSPANILREWNNTDSPYVYNSIPYTGTSVSIPLTGYSGNQYIAFYGESTASNADNDFMINDVQIKLLETYPLPPSDPVPALAATGVDVITNLSWANDGTVTKIDVYFSTDSTLVATLDEDARVATNWTSTLQSYDLPVLSYDQLYYWRIACKNDADSTVAGPLWYFSTRTDPSIAMPWTEGFPTTSWPTGWNSNYTLSSSTAYGNPQPGAYKYTSSIAGQGYINLPQTGPVTAYPVLAFDYWWASSPSGPTAYVMNQEDSINFYLSDDYGQTYTRFHTINYTNHHISTNWARVQLPLWPYGSDAGEKIRIRIENLYKNQSYYLLFDNFSITSAPDSAIYALTPTSWDFGGVDLTLYAEKEFTLSNSGAEDLTITGIALSDTLNFKLRDVPDPLPTLGFGETAQFKVRFIPQSSGLKTVTLTITDDVARDTHVYTDSLRGTGLAPYALPFEENFDSRHTAAVSPADAWVVGTPNKTAYLQSAHSTPNAIVTRSLTANYNANELSYVTLPALDVSDQETGVIVSFWHDFDTHGVEATWDNLILEYSTDLGATWARVDSTLGTGPYFTTANSYNWYNQDSVNGPIDGPKYGGLSEDYAGADTTGWIQSGSLIPLSAIESTSTLKFRFNFGSDSSTQYEGWAIDDIYIFSQPTNEYALSGMTADELDYVIKGDSVIYSVTVTNNGFNPDGVWVRFLVNSTVVDSVHSGPIDSFDSAVVDFKYAIPTARDYGTDYLMGFQIPADEVNTNNAAELTVRAFNPGWLAQGFEGAFLPSKWIKWGVPYWNQGTGSPYDGDYDAQVTLASDSPGSYLASPRVAIATGDSLIFWAKSTVAGMQIQLHNSALPDTTVSWDYLDTAISLTTDYVRYAIDLSSLSGNNERLAFEAKPNGNAGTVYLDRVLGPVFYTPTGDPGPAVMISPDDKSTGIDPMTVVLDWSEPLSGGEAQAYYVVIGFKSDPDSLLAENVHADIVYAPDTQYQVYPAFTMDYLTSYYWMVVPYNDYEPPRGNANVADCPVWKFTTKPEPLGGAWTINPTGPDSTGNNFQSFTSCINYLNAWGVKEGGVTITVYDTTYVEVIPAITYNGTATTQAVFVGSSSKRSKPVIMAGTGTGTTVPDAILRLYGADYVTFDGFDIKENPANTDATTQMEYGIYVYNNGASDGAKYNTIKNCNLTLAGTSVTRGVYQYATSVTAEAGSNSYNKYLDNDLANCWYGYYLYGSSTAAAYDSGTEIGAVTDGSIAGCLHGVNYSNQTGLKVYNQDIVLLGGSAPTAALYGVYATTGTSNTVEIYGNDITQAAAMTASYTMYGFYLSSNSQASIHGNTIHDLDTPTSQYGIYLSGGGTGQTNYVFENILYNTTMAAGTYYGIYVTAGVTNEIFGNEIHHITVNGSSYAYVMYIGSSSSSNVNHVYENSVHDITTTGSVYPYGAYLYYGTTDFYANEIYNISSTSLTYPIYSYYGSYNKNIYDNQVYNVTQTGTSALYGIYLYYTSGATYATNCYGNTIHTLSGGGITRGIYVYGASSTTSYYNVYKNKVYDITYSGTGTSVCEGIGIYGSSSAATINAYNNFIWDIKAPSGSALATATQVSGIYTSTAKAINLWNNTVYLNATSSNANFGSAGLYMYSGATVDIQNNIFVNKSNPNTGGRAVAFWKGSSGTISTTTDKNIWYAGDPADSHPIYYDGTNTKVTIDDYKTFMGTKEQNSASEDVPFNGEDRLFDLHIDPLVATYVEGHANVIAAVTKDIDDEDRGTGSPNYPDIGADEGTFTPLTDVTTPIAQPANLALVPYADQITGTFDVSDAGYYLVVRHVLSPLNAVPTQLKKYALGDTLGANGIVAAKVSTGAFSSTGLQVDSLYYFTIFGYNQNAVYGPKYLVTGPLTGSKRTLPAPPAAPSALTATPYSGTQINLSATATDSILVAWNWNGTFGTLLPYPAYAVGDTIVGGGKVLYLGPAAGLTNHTGLNPSTAYYYKAWTYKTSDVYKVYSNTGAVANTTTYFGFPYSQNFDGVPSSSWPTGWAKVGTDGSVYTQTSDNYSAPNCVYIYTSSTSAPAICKTPTFETTVGAKYKIKFMGRANYTAGAPIDIGYLADHVNGSSFTLITSHVMESLTYAQYSTEFIAVSGLTTFAYKNPGVPLYSALFDDVEIKLVPTYPEEPESPSPALAATGQMPGGQLAWSNNGTVTKVDVYFSPDSLAVVNLSSGARYVENQTSPLESCVLPSLSLNTRYFWRVVCKNDIGQTATGPLWYFNTVETEPALPLPYAQDFGSSTTLPAGWTKSSNMYISSTHGNPSYGLYSNLDSSGEVCYAAMPLLGPAGDVTILEFDYRLINYPLSPLTAKELSAGDSLNVSVSEDYGATFTRVGSVNSTNHTATTDWTRMQINLTGYGIASGDRIVLRFDGTFGAGDWYLDMDNYNVFVLPNSAVFVVTPDSLNYGEVELYDSSEFEFEVSNGGTVPFNVTSVYVEGGDAAEFDVDAPGLSEEVTWQTPYTFTVTCEPASTGPKSTTLKIVDDIARVTHEVPLVANAIPEVIGYPVNLEAAVSDYNNVNLTWGMQAGLTPPWIGWSTKTHAWNFKPNDYVPFSAAARFTTADLARFSGQNITKINFKAPSYANTTYQLRVWTGADTTLTPTTIVVDSTLTHTVSVWNEITLNTPVPITGSEAIWIGYYVPTYDSTAFPAAIDDGPEVFQRGCVWSDGGRWQNYGGNNLLIEAYVASDPARGEAPLLSLPVRVDALAAPAVAVAEQLQTDNTRALTGFNVYRGTTQLNTGLIPSTTLAYDDLSVPNGTYVYIVEAVYETGESYSNPVEVEIDKPAPITLPFNESWVSGSFDTNLWTPASVNWAVNASVGNPTPAARFYYSPINSSGYNYSLTSWEIDATAASELNLKYDVMLDNNLTATVENLAVDVFDGTDWVQVDVLNNQSGDIPWTTRTVNVSAQVGGSVFQVRFRAYGSDTGSIWYWAVDNIKAEEIVPPEPPVVTASFVAPNQVLLDWDDVANATSYKVYASYDAYADFPSGWSLIGTPTSSSFNYTMLIMDYFRYFRVVAVGAARNRVLSQPADVNADRRFRDTSGK